MDGATSCTKRVPKYPSVPMLAFRRLIMSKALPTSCGWKAPGIFSTPVEAFGTREWVCVRVQHGARHVVDVLMQPARPRLGQAATRPVLSVQQSRRNGNILSCLANADSVASCSAINLFTAKAKTVWPAGTPRCMNRVPCAAVRVQKRAPAREPMQSGTGRPFLKIGSCRPALLLASAASQSMRGQETA